MALTADRNTPYRDGKMLVLGVAAATKIYAGSMVAADAAGNIVPAANAAGLVVLGRAEEQVDNSSGLAGDKSVQIRRRKVFAFINSTTNPVTAAFIGRSVFVEDDATVSSQGGSGSIVAGTCLGFADSMVEVEIA